MSPTQYIEALRELGLTPYGGARHIGVSIRQSLRYASGKTEIPEPVAKLITMMIATKRETPLTAEQIINKALHSTGSRF
jgi:hypothetical protein